MQNLEDLCDIIKSRPGRRYRIPEEEKQLVMELYNSGLSPGRIAEKLWYEYDMARPTSVIDGIIRREYKNWNIDYKDDE